MTTHSEAGFIDAHLNAAAGADSSSWSSLVSTMADAGVTQAVAIQMERDFEQSRAAIQWADATEAVCAVAAWIDVAGGGVENDLAELASSSKFKSVALPVYLQEDNHWLVSPGVLEGIRSVAAKGFNLDIQVEPRQIPSVGELAEAIPDLKIAIAHIGSPFIARSEREPWGVYMLNVAPHPNVYAKVSGLLTLDTQPWSVAHERLFVESMVRMFGYDRLMFGSDWPNPSGIASYGETGVTASESAGPMTPEQRAQLMGITARSFYSIT